MKKRLSSYQPLQAYQVAWLGLTVVLATTLAACTEPTIKEPVQRHAVTRPAGSDPMAGLIRQQQRRPADAPSTQPIPSYETIDALTVRNASFEYWLNTHPYHRHEVEAYQNYLAAHISPVPPIDQLVVSARDAVSCGYEPYEVPPRELWPNIVPTLQVFNQLKQQGYVPRATVIRSVYRNPSLNACAGGASESKHMTNGAIDIWMPDIEGDKWATEQTMQGLCQFWMSQGGAYNLGLGLYPSGAVHLDTQGYRKWGGNHSASSSPCGF